MKFFDRFKRNKVVYSEPKMYVLVRSDLVPGLQLAQACHAASYLSASNPLALYQHPTTIVLGVSSEEELLNYASSEGFLFREPDLDGAATAYACYSQGYEFANLNLALSIF